MDPFTKRHAVSRARFFLELAKQCWAEWWSSLLSDPVASLFCNKRDQILKNAPPKIGQIVRLGGSPAKYATELYCYEDTQTPTTVTVERYLEALEEHVRHAEKRFAT